MSNIALVVVDLQKAFFDKRLSPVTGHLAKAICLPGVRLLLARARQNGWTVVHVITVHKGADSLPVPLSLSGCAPFCLAGSEGAEIVTGLKQSGDFVVEKCHYSGFDHTDLAVMLEPFDSLVIAGIAADCCILHTAFDAGASHNKIIYLPYQAISASHEDDYVSGLRHIAKSAGAVVDLDTLLQVEELDWRLKIDLDAINKTLSNWFSPRLEVAKAFEQEYGAGDLNVDQMLSLLENRLVDASPA